MAQTIYLLLGSNEGDRLGQLMSAVDDLTQYIASGAVICSRVYETAAWGMEDQPPFLNMAIRMDTILMPEGVLQAVHRVEQAFGRQRAVRWGQRTLDVDILFYGSEIVQLPHLHIPHPQLQQRRFALAPMAEIAPEFMHPTLHKTMSELLCECADPLPVQPFTEIGTDREA